MLVEDLAELTTVLEALVPSDVIVDKNNPVGLLVSPFSVPLASGDGEATAESLHLSSLLTWLNHQLAVAGVTEWHALLNAPTTTKERDPIQIQDVDVHVLRRFVSFVVMRWRFLPELRLLLLRILIVLSFSKANATAMLQWCHPNQQQHENNEEGRSNHGHGNAALVHAWCSSFVFEDVHQTQHKERKTFRRNVFESEQKEDGVLHESGDHLEFASLVLVWMAQLLRVRLNNADDSLGQLNKRAYETRQQPLGPNLTAVQHVNARHNDGMTNAIRREFRARSPHTEMSLVFMASRCVTLAGTDHAVVCNALFFLRMYAKIDLEHACTMSTVFALSQRALACLRGADAEDGFMIARDQLLEPVSLTLRFTLSVLHESTESASAQRTATLAPLISPVGLVVVECGMIMPILSVLQTFAEGLESGECSKMLTEIGCLAVGAAAMLRGVEGFLDNMVKWKASIWALGKILQCTNDMHVARCVLAIMGTLFSRPAFKLEHDEAPRPSVVAPSETLMKWARMAVASSLDQSHGSRAKSKTREEEVHSDANTLHADLTLAHVLQVAWTHLHALEDAAQFICQDGMALCFGLIRHPWKCLSQLAMTVATGLMKRFPELIPAVVEEFPVRLSSANRKEDVHGKMKYWLGVTVSSRHHERNTAVSSQIRGFKRPTIATIVSDCRECFLQVYAPAISSETQLRKAFVDFKDADDNARLGGVNFSQHLTARARTAVTPRTPTTMQSQPRPVSSSPSPARYRDVRTKISFQMLLLLCHDARARKFVERQSNFKRNRLSDILLLWQQLENAHPERKRQLLYAQGSDLPIAMQTTRLARCNLASCQVTESYIKQFAMCDFCQQVVYCRAQHKDLDRAIHFRYCRKPKAKTAIFLTKQNDTKQVVETRKNLASAKWKV